MSKKKIYIAGRVSGEDLGECTMKFGTAQKKVENMGFQAVNPLEVVGDWKATWKEAMQKCIKELVDCDAVLMLPCAPGSRGACIEKQLAYDLDIPVGFNLKDLKNFEL